MDTVLDEGVDSFEQAAEVGADEAGAAWGGDFIPAPREGGQGAGLPYLQCQSTKNEPMTSELISWQVGGVCAGQEGSSGCLGMLTCHWERWRPEA